MFPLSSPFARVFIDFFRMNLGIYSGLSIWSLGLWMRAPLHNVIALEIATAAPRPLLQRQEGRCVYLAASSDRTHALSNSSRGPPPRTSSHCRPGLRIMGVGLTCSRRSRTKYLSRTARTRSGDRSRSPYFAATKCRKFQQSLGSAS